MADLGGRVGPAIVMVDPFHPYARRFIDVAYERWGVRTVALITDAAARRRYEGDGPALSGAAVLARHHVPRCSLEEVAAALRERYDVRGVVPFHELQVDVVARLRDALGVPGSPASTYARFRDKHALKAHVGSQPDAPRLNHAARVQGVGEVRDVLAAVPFDRFVLKPNSGTGNSRIAFFSRDDSDRAIGEYFTWLAGDDVLLEERLDGDEYCVNGQIDSGGRVRVQSIFRTHHVVANGRTNLASHFSLVATSDPAFELLRAYACDVVAATGLVGSPFHMEVIVDADGPCLVEVAARLAGAGMAFDTELAHGGVLDVFAAALSDYAALPLPGAAAANWARYDATGLWTVCGVHHRRERVDAVHGVRAVEMLPEFSHWVYRPRIGRVVEPTVDLATIPWQVTLVGDPRCLGEVAQSARDSLRINDFATALDRGVGRLESMGARAGRLSRAMWAAVGEPSTRLPTRPTGSAEGAPACTTS